MAPQRRKRLRDLLADRAKGQMSKHALGSQPYPVLPSPHPPLQGSFLPMPNLKKKRKEKDKTEEEEVVRQKEPKQQKIANGQVRASSIESREEHDVVEVCHQNPTWAPWLELNGAAILRNSTIREF